MKALFKTSLIQPKSDQYTFICLDHVTLVLSGRPVGGWAVLIVLDPRSFQSRPYGSALLHGQTDRQRDRETDGQQGRVLVMAP